MKATLILAVLLLVLLARDAGYPTEPVWMTLSGAALVALAGLVRQGMPPPRDSR